MIHHSFTTRSTFIGALAPRSDRFGLTGDAGLQGA
jgi:hypothetical protein